MIQYFSPDDFTSAQAVTGPKVVWWDVTRIVVYTGVDIPPTPVLTQDDQDRAAAKSYAKLTALKSMTPAQIQAWVSANVTNLSQAQDAIATLAIAVGILARNL